MGSLQANGMPTTVAAVRREHIEAWVGDLLENWKDSTALNRYKSAQQFFRWAVDDGEIERSPMERIVHRRSRSSPRRSCPSPK